MRHCATALVERTVPGGLVTRHRQWFWEERAVHERFFTSGHCWRNQQRRVRASRALFFARIGLAKGDFAFGLSRLTEAFLAAPLDAAFMAARRLLRYRQGASGTLKVNAPGAR